ncbi:MAG: lysine transporter LysE [Actinobacteria bacterium HGW-Actinobacteria-4]|nr:MAG: lysine transporter LysE [Actinobacteria bacterium HGW-Actinobacteria-4]
MISTHALAAFVALAVVIILLPGPSVLFIVSRALQHGRSAALMTAVGNTCGVFIHVVVVAIGIGAIVAASATAFLILKIAGGGYLILLGVQAIRHRREGMDNAAADAVVGVPLKTGALWREAFVVGVLNPKTIVFLAAVLPQFVDPARGPAWAQMLVLGLVFNALSVLLDSGYALAASGARAWFASSPTRVERMKATGGVMMAGLGVALLVSRRAA